MPGKRLSGRSDARALNNALRLPTQFDDTVSDAARGARARMPAGEGLEHCEDCGDPFSGVIYVFRAKRSDRIKLIWWDGTGLCLMAKKLEQGGFRWPGIQDGVMRVTAAQLGALLEGLDWRRVHGGRRPQAPQIAG